MLIALLASQKGTITHENHLENKHMKTLKEQCKTDKEKNGQDFKTLKNY